MEINGRMTLNYGIELSESCREVTWNPLALNGHFKKDNNIQFKHHLTLKRAVIGPNSKEGELNCIEVVAKDDVLFEEKQRPLTYLKFGTIFENNINMTFLTPPVKFILSQGNGPVYIHSDQIIDPEFQLDEDDKSDIDADEEILKRAATKRPLNRMDLAIPKRMRLGQQNQDDEDDDEDEDDNNVHNNLDLEEEQEDHSGDEDQESQSDDEEEIDVVEEVEEEEEEVDEDEEQQEENDENEDEEDDEIMKVPQEELQPQASNIGYVIATDAYVDAESDSEIENEAQQIVQPELDEGGYSEEDQEDEN